jgi:hypothetical protein
MYDPLTPDGLKTLQDMYVAKHPGATPPDANALKEQRALAQESTTYNIDTMRNNLGDATFNSIKARIDAGATWEQVQQEFGTTINQGQYNAMRTYSAAGVSDWNKQLSGINILLSTPGAANLTNAGTQLNNMFSGLGVDFTQLINKNNQAEFSGGMEALAKFATLPGSFDEQKAAMQAAGVFDQLPGMNEAQVKGLFDNMVLFNDPLYKATSAIKDSTLQTIFPEATTPAQLSSVRSGLARLSAFGGLKINSDGSFAVDYDLMKSVLGEGWMKGLGGSTDTTTDPYAGYTFVSKDATNATFKDANGHTVVMPISDVQNIPSLKTAAGVTGDTLQPGQSGFKYSTKALEDSAWNTLVTANSDADRTRWAELGYPTKDAYAHADLNSPSLSRAQDEIANGGLPTEPMDLPVLNDWVTKNYTGSASYGTLNVNQKEIPIVKAATDPNDTNGTYLDGKEFLNSDGSIKSDFKTLITNNEGKSIQLNGKWYTVPPNAFHSINLSTAPGWANIFISGISDDTHQALNLVGSDGQTTEFVFSSSSGLRPTRSRSAF